MSKSKVIEAVADKPAAPEPPAEAQSQGRSKVKRHPELDAALGARIRVARVAARMSQGTLGAAVGISFQQLQKYEWGKDRVAATTLQAIAAVLGVHPGSFFDDTPIPVGDVPDLTAAMQSAEVLQQVSNARVLKQLLALAKVLADAESAGLDAPEGTTQVVRRRPVS